MDVHVRANIGVNLHGIKGVLAVVVVAQRQVHFARNERAAFFRVEAHIEVSDLKNGDGLVGLNFPEVDIAHANADTAFVLSARSIVIARRVVVERLRTIRLFVAPRSVRIGEANRVGRRHTRQRQVTGVDLAREERGDELSDVGEGPLDVE